MPSFKGKGPHDSSGLGRGRRQGSGAGGFRADLKRNLKYASDINRSDYVENAMKTHPYIYHYSLEELKERKQELGTEIQWLNDRIKELEETKK